jgi:hypothetical protein
MESLADDKAEAKYGKEAFCIGFNIGAVSLLAPWFVNAEKLTPPSSSLWWQ